MANIAVKITAAGLLVGGAAAAAWKLKASQGGAEGGGDTAAPVAAVGQDSGGKAHTSLDQGHPAGEGPRSDRDVGGPTTAPDASPDPGGATGTKPSGPPAHD